jgi:hypothetical protein
MDSTMSPKVKTSKGKGVGAHSLACNILGVEGHAGAPRWELGRLTRNSLIHTDLHKPNKLVSAWLEHFGAQTNHGQTQIHKIHRSPDLGEATNFPLIVYYVLGHGTNTQMSFCSRTPKWVSRNSHNWDFCDFGGP